MPTVEDLIATSVEELDTQSVAPSVEEIDTQSVVPSIEEIDTQSVEEIDAPSVKELNIHMQFKGHGVLEKKWKNTKKEDMKPKQMKQEANVKVNLSIILL